MTSCKSVIDNKHKSLPELLLGDNFSMLHKKVLLETTNVVVIVERN
jgi:hypothetical protein